MNKLWQELGQIPEGEKMKFMTQNFSSQEECDFAKRVLKVVNGHDCDVEEQCHGSCRQQLKLRAFDLLIGFIMEEN